MKKFHRRRAHGRRILLCLLALALLFVVLALRQNILLDTTSRHALLMDAQTGQVLAQKRANEKVAPASLTKMMTVLLAIEAQPDLDQPVTLPEDVFPELTAENASMAGFAPGETVTVRDVLYGAMLPSGAECCEALARLVSGSESAFVALMNQKAAELGMKNTHFCNPIGLTETEHYSTAADLATSTPTAQHPEGVSFASTLLSKLNGSELSDGQDKILGGKTGYTAAAGLCLASLATVQGREYILVTLGAPGSHITEQFNIQDAISVYQKLETKMSAKR